MNYGIQLYSIRDIIKDDFEKVLCEVSKMGYEYIETAGFFGHSAEQIKEWLNKYNLKISGTHAGFNDLDERFEETVKFHKTLGNKKFIIAGTDTSTREALDVAVEKFNKYQPMLAQHGIELGYHNHWREFVLNNDMIYPNFYFMEKSNIKFEIDTFWVFAARWDPIDILNQFGSRLVGCIHLKDGVRYPRIKGYSLGNGAAPVREVIAKAKDMGVLMVVESEGLEPSGLEEVKRCADFLKNNG